MKQRDGLTGPLSLPKTLERFWQKVHTVPHSGCWIWVGAASANGYGNFLVGDKYLQPHRASYMMFVGPIPGGLHLDHLCRVTYCVNPAHLEPVTCAENLRRGMGPKLTSARMQAKTHCPNGHAYTPENTRYNSQAKHRQCLICLRANQKRKLQAGRLKRQKANAAL